MEGLIVFAHGSRVSEANESVARVAEAAARKGGFPVYQHAFLELAEPTLEMAVQSLHQRGARRIIVAPYFLVMGIHLQKDLPALLASAAKACPGVELMATPPLEGHPALADILAERAQAARATLNAPA